MLDPILEIYVLWHPDDPEGAERAERVVEHFHGTAYSGLIGGAVEVYLRSEPWGEDGSPRPLPFQEPPAYGIPAPALVAVVPVLSYELAEALEREEGKGWLRYLEECVHARSDDPERVGIYPLLDDSRLLAHSIVGELFGDILYLGAGEPLQDGDDQHRRQLRDLAQGIAQQSGGAGRQRIQVFISHTKHATREGPDQVLRIETVRNVIDKTHLQEFFDAIDLQPGRDWADELEEEAARSALLCVRTDLYSSREWCQKEVSVAKRSGVPVVILDSLQSGEERGSFLMDHVPRIPGNDAREISREAIFIALDQLVDECLKRELWRRQRELDGDESFDWWAPHAPEPLTLVGWLHASGFDAGADGESLRILHPDPPLGRDEIAVLRQIFELTGCERELEILTPRTMAGGSE